MKSSSGEDFLQEIDGLEAFENIRKNKFSTWPNRSGDNRVEPICQPHFHAPFSVVPGAAIFTIGSCFARNVERSLKALGFDIPTHRALPEGASTAVLNNYTAPSMLNEVRWAFDDDAPFDPATHLYSVGTGKVVDLHLGGRWSHPTDFDTACERRKNLHAANRQLANSSLLILTLGLAEAWFDRELQIYLNSPPMKSLIKDNPGRFAVHILSQRQIVDSLRALVKLASDRNTKGGLNVVVTVSPVPLAATFREDTDVVLANAYSKSALRSAAEEVALCHENVAYFPSFESITLSDRHETWEDDQVHVRQKLIDVNVARMVSQYTAQSAETINDPDILAQMAQTGLQNAKPDVALEHAEMALRLDSRHDRAILCKITALHRLKRRDDALAFFFLNYTEGATVSDDPPHETKTYIAHLLFRSGRADEALDMIEPVVRKFPKSMPINVLLGDIHMVSGRLDEAERVFNDCLAISNRVGLPYAKLAQVDEKRGDLEAAVAKTKIARTINPSNQMFDLQLQRLQEQSKGS